MISLILSIGSNRLSGMTDKELMARRGKWYPDGEHWIKIRDTEIWVKDIIDAITNESTVTVSPHIFKRKVLNNQGVIAKAALMREGKWEWRKPILSKQMHSGRPQIAIDGNHRIAAAILAGIDQVPVIWVDHIVSEILEGRRSDIMIIRNSVIIRA